MSFVRIAASIVSVHGFAYTTEHVAERSVIGFSVVFYEQGAHFRAALECLKNVLKGLRAEQILSNGSKEPQGYAIPDLPPRPML